MDLLSKSSISEFDHFLIETEGLEVTYSGFLS